MEFRIADTFTDSLAKLNGDEQKSVKTTAFDLQLNPANPGMQFHKLDRAKDPNFWSVRVSRDIRLIVHKTDSSLLLCYVGHHDKAYHWAERRKLVTHPKTGAAQLVEVREMVREITVPKYVAPVDMQAEQALPPKSLLFIDISDDELLSYGVPAEWLDDVRASDEDGVLDLAGHLPAEAAEALLELATGGTPQITQPVIVNADPFEHPDALRRFRVMANVEELDRALDYPWEKWTIFLHPTQRQWVEKDYNGPARVSGSAGTGKTIVALHRAVFLARNHPDARVLLTTFSELLANSLRTKLRRLISNEPHIGERLEVHSIDAIGRRLYEIQFGSQNIVSREELQQLLMEASGEVEGHKFSQRFLITEWNDVVDAWRLETWESYRDVRRLGRKTRLSEQQRQVLWSIFDRVRLSIVDRGLLTYPGLFSQLSSQIAERKHPPSLTAMESEAKAVSPR
ncbi:MAG: UvrD-helicase domain-containing protein [Candidatus Thiodiazotropha sp.]